MNRSKKKIKSNNGASITFALLLFLMCAVISSVVIVAATAAGGRMSQLAESDQRYYAVASAVELLKDDFEGKKVKIIYKETESGPEITKLVEIADDTEYDLQRTNSILADATSRFVEKNAASATVEEDPKFNLTVNLGDSSEADLNCKIKEYVKEDGRVILEVSKDVDENKKYAMQVIFEAHTSETTSTSKNNVVTVTSIVEWKFNSIRKGTVS